jgi:hypothetical protein
MPLTCAWRIRRGRSEVPQIVCAAEVIPGCARCSPAAERHRKSSTSTLRSGRSSPWPRRNCSVAGWDPAPSCGPHAPDRWRSRPIEQVILNLIMNAVEASAGLSAGVKELRVSTELDVDGHVRVAVRDEGVGFDSAIATRLFGSACPLAGPSSTATADDCGRSGTMGRDRPSPSRSRPKSRRGPDASKVSSPLAAGRPGRGNGSSGGADRGESAGAGHRRSGLVLRKPVMRSSRRSGNYTPV